MVPSASLSVLPPTPSQVVKNSFLHFPKHAVQREKPVHSPRSSSCPPAVVGPSPPQPSLPESADIPLNATTLMVRNLPTRFTPVSLLRVFEDSGFGGTLDFFYCPIDFRTSKNQGYCFVNFVHPTFAHMFANIFHGTRLGVTTSTKILHVSASRRQGLVENVALFRGSDLLSSFSLPFFKPFVLVYGELMPLCESLFELIMSGDCVTAAVY